LQIILNSDKKLEKILAVISNLQVRYLTNQQIFKNVTNAECERAINILTSRYSSFGILEKMEDSVKLFKARKPNWLNLIEKVPVKNVNKANTSKRKPNNDILSLIKDLNSKDMILYEYAIALFNSYLALENEKAV